VLFLVVYDRERARIVSLDQIQEENVQPMFDRRLELELGPHADQLEVVILEAESESDLHQSHARYFDAIRGLLAKSV
jgi:hypothetical protein